MKYLIIIALLFCVGCKESVKRETIKDLKSGTRRDVVEERFGDPDEYYLSKNDKDKEFFVYNNGKTQCALDFKFGHLYHTNCVETR